MERVKKGEKYWFIDFSGMYVVDWLTEFYDEENTTHFLTKNYFHTEEEAEAMARRFRAVLKGAEVIEIPNKPLGPTDIKNNHLRGYVPERLSINDLKAFALGFWEGCDWLASKIVK